MPATVVLALSALAIDPKVAINDSWFHTFANPVCRVVENPPFEPTYYVKSKSPLAESHRKAFASWFEKAKPELEAETAKEKGKLDQARKESDEAAGAFSKVGVR